MLVKVKGKAIVIIDHFANVGECSFDGRQPGLRI